MVLGTALAEEEAAERKAAVVALKAEREAQLEAMRQEAAKREAELAAQTAAKAPETSEPAGDAFEFTEVDMSWDDVPEGLKALLMRKPQMFCPRGK